MSLLTPKRQFSYPFSILQPVKSGGTRTEFESELAE